MVEFLGRRLGPLRSHAEPRLVWFGLPNGDAVEVLTIDDANHRYAITGRVVGFRVDNVAASRRELEDAGVMPIGAIGGGGGVMPDLRVADAARAGPATKINLYRSPD